MDCTNQPIARVGAGPLHDGPGAPRADPDVWLQRVFYNGWLGHHGIKYGTMDTPDGMTIFSAPGISSRHCDLYWLRETDLSNLTENPLLHHRLQLILLCFLP